MINMLLTNEFNLATFIVGIFSLIGVIVNIIVTTVNNKKKRYTDLITQRRINTMQNLIDSSSNCIKSLYGVMNENCNYDAILQTFIENKSQIFYDTNYKGKSEQELRFALDALQDLLIKYILNKNSITQKQKEQIFKTIKCGVEYYQLLSCVYCKCEWIRIKETTLSVKESVDTQMEYDNRIKELSSKLETNKNILFNNTFENIVNKK